MSLKNKVLIFIGFIVIAFTIYKLYPTPTPPAPLNTYTIVFFDKTLSNNYGEVEIENHKTVLLKSIENLKEKGDKVKVFYINAITESESNKTPNAEINFAHEIPEDGGYIDKENAEREYNNQLYILKKQAKKDLLAHFESKGDEKHSHYTDAWGILNRLKVEASSFEPKDRIDVLIFSDMEESMNTSKGRRDFTKDKMNDIQTALKTAQDDISKIKRLYALDSIPFAENIKIKLYFPKAKEGKAEMEAYWTEIFSALNINVEVNS